MGLRRRRAIAHDADAAAVSAWLESMGTATEDVFGASTWQPVEGAPIAEDRVEAVAAPVILQVIHSGAVDGDSAGPMRLAAGPN